MTSSSLNTYSCFERLLQNESQKSDGRSDLHSTSIEVLSGRGSPGSYYIYGPGHMQEVKVQAGVFSAWLNINNVHPD